MRRRWQLFAGRMVTLDILCDSVLPGVNMLGGVMIKEVLVDVTLTRISMRRSIY